MAGAVALGAIACAGPEEPPYVPPNLSDPGIERRSCEPAADAPKLRQIGTVRPFSLVVGDCGELAWREDTTHGLPYYAASDGGPRVMPDAVDASGFGHWPIWIGGEQILMADRQSVYLADGGKIVREWETGDVGAGSQTIAPTLGKISGTDAFWACSSFGNGVLRLDEKGMTELTPDIGGAPSPCWAIDVSPAGTLAYPTESHRIGVVDLVTGSRKTFDHPFFPRGSLDEDGHKGRDAVRVSPDGSFVLHEERRYDSDDRQVMRDHQREVALVTAAGPPVWMPGGVQETPLFEDHFIRARNPWMSKAPGVFVPGNGADSHLVGVGAPIPLPDTEVLAMRGEHLFVKTGEGVAVLELRTGALHHLFSADWVEEAVPFRWGGPVAFSHLSKRCMEWTKTSDCYSRAWALSTWTVERGSKEVVWAVDQPKLHAVGPDGSMIASGRFFNGPPSGHSHWWDIEERLLLIAPDGRVVRELSHGSSVVEGLGGEHFALLKRQRQRDVLEDLVAVDWATGEEKVLATGVRIHNWSLDHSDQRVKTTVIYSWDDRVAALLSGVVKRPGG